MGPMLRIAMMSVLLLVACCAAGADHEQAAPRLILRVAADGWGDASPVDVERLLTHTARELLRYFPDRKLDPIEVEAKGGPIVLFERGPDNAYRVRLATGGLYWSQYAYQFSHELCHILCHYDADPHGQDWFEEALCELASLYTLRRMGESWKTDPPYPHWKSYAPNLTEYAQQRIDKAQLPDGQTLARWYRKHEKKLRTTPLHRDMQNVVAVALLDLFEQQPDSWETVTWLNTATPDEPQTFQRFLRDWLDHAPPRHHLFIRKIAARFGIALEDDE